MLIVPKGYEKTKDKNHVNTADAGVVINGVRWATRNVAACGIFADRPEDAGMFYQWNRKTAWNVTDSIVSDWGNTISTGAEWEKANGPSPAGWRVPILAEIQSLLDTGKVSSKRTTQNGVKGRRFIDKTTKASLFLPAVGYRSGSSLYYAGAGGYYWSCTQPDGYAELAYYLHFYQGNSDQRAYYRFFGFSLRCVSIDS